MTGGRAIRWSTVAAVAAVAVVAGWVSYVHAYDVVRAHGEHGPLARLYPGTIDGLIYSASMVLLDAARRGVRPPPLARWLLTAGIGATLFANVLAGAAYGVLGAAVAAWPAAALVGSYELLMWLVRQGTAAPVSAPVTASGDAAGMHLPPLSAHPVTASGVHPPDAPVAHLNGSGAPAPGRAVTRTRTQVRTPVTGADAEAHFAADLASGQLPSARRIRRELKVGQPRAAELRQHLETVTAGST